MRVLREQGLDPFKVALDHAHATGLQFHACFLVAGFHFPPPLDLFNQFGKPFFKADPEWRGVDHAAVARRGRRLPDYAGGVKT